ncbi:hypothetical protein M8C21_020853 [Ambrosia artemisiifolia]|uniref:Uncharacterized protein n=1 Tax=Ambrosia artemisiifolia TaxID=4212 RepID=A0AAD5DB27_AMBAR|nr:hypothetical protein M8C21_020853 [Ambrosia artemisiifolia]
MASSSISIIFGGLFIILLSLWSSSSYANGCYTSIISFGDSLADTGNLKQLGSITNRVFPVFSPPYGENFIDQSTGRCSNGRLIIDFLVILLSSWTSSMYANGCYTSIISFGDSLADTAERLELPLIPPFLQTNGINNMVTFKQGVNYAVAGATALDRSVLEPKGVVNPMTNASLGVQLTWFKRSLPSICGNYTNCRDFIGQSLILVGEIGGNDYNYPILWGKPIEEVDSLVPLVIDTIISAITDLIEMGAKTLVVPGNFPVGCSASYLTVCGSENEEYDPITGCLVRLNQFAEYHNKLLQTKLKQVQDLHPNVNLFYADYYNAAMEIYLHPYKYGFTNGALKACCGGEGRYNVNPSVECGDASATVCDEPDTYVSWDGIHLTEAAYRIISKNLFSTPQFNSLCSTSTSGVGLTASIFFCQLRVSAACGVKGGITNKIWSENLSLPMAYGGFLVILVTLLSSCLYFNGCYKSIISFGDSLANTGNLKHLAAISNRVFPYFLPPYGENFINQSTGRCSNGRLIIDFLAESLGLPLVPPFLPDNGTNNNVTFKQGVNYAVACATAMDTSVLEARGVINTMTNASLGVELAWFKQSLPSICGNESSCRDFIGRSLIFMGEIGGNDYNFGILWGKPIEVVEPLVPLVIDTIISVVNDLIEMGAKTLVVPGNFPIGCSSTYLTVCGSAKEEYDPITGCLIRLNQFAEYHNIMLQTKLKQAQDLHHNVNIFYADYYNAAMEIYLSPNKFGFTNGALKACCGAGGRYNVNLSVRCGEESSTVCDEPDTFVSWDGIHLTEAAYRIISRSLFSTPQFRSLCSTSSSEVDLSVSM